MATPDGIPEPTFIIDSDADERTRALIDAVEQDMRADPNRMIDAVRLMRLGSDAVTQFISFWDTHPDGLETARDVLRFLAERADTSVTFDPASEAAMQEVTKPAKGPTAEQVLAANRRTRLTTMADRILYWQNTQAAATGPTETAA